MIEEGTAVDLHYYGESHSVHTLRGTVAAVGVAGVMLDTGYGTSQFFPWASVQRVVPTN